MVKKLKSNILKYFYFNHTIYILKIPQLNFLLIHIKYTYLNFFYIFFYLKLIFLIFL